MRIGEMLVSARVVSQPQLMAAIAEQQRWGGKLGQILVRMGALSEELLVLALCQQLSLPRADLAAVHFVDDALRQRLDRAACERYRVLPLAYAAERRTTLLAMSDPFDVAAIDDLTSLLGTRIEPYLVGDNALAAAIRRLYDAASTHTPLTAQSDAIPLIDNAGNPRTHGMGSPALAPALAAPTSAPGDFAGRIEEQLRAVRAVAALLVERGVIRPDDLPR